MQFKYPELLWALLALLIPIFIHLFQLRRFKKTAFTNVKLLQKVVSESRKSSTIKKWLLLATRLLLIGALVIAFAQPFFAEIGSLQEKETVIYLDDSFSMQAKINTSSLLETAIQELIGVIPKDQKFSLFTNHQSFSEVTIDDIQNDLLQLNFTEEQLKLDEIYLKAATFFSPNQNTQKRILVISDFQERIAPINDVESGNIQSHLVKLVPSQIGNIAIDSAFINSTNEMNLELTVLLSSNSEIESVPVSLFNKAKLIAKTSAVFDSDRKAKIDFTLAKDEVIDAKIEIQESGLSYDNQLFFNINQKEKIKVLVINEGNADYLKRIFPEKEFQFLSYPPSNLNYSLLESQNIIFLNELKAIPNGLYNALVSFSTNGGSLVIIPSNEPDINTYNQLLNPFFATAFAEKITAERNISNIAFSHPLYTNVFEKQVTNFLYPKVFSYLKIKTNAPPILSFENGDPFLVGLNGIYAFTASIATENSNFKNSPLIVPTLYKMGINSLKLPELYQVIGFTNQLDIPVLLEKDNIIKIVKDDYEFIPKQQSLANKVSLFFDENLWEDGIFNIINGDTNVGNISFNYPRTESNLVYMNTDNIKSNSYQTSIPALFKSLEKDNLVTELWKWFIILALLFILVEVLIQKFLK